MTAAPFDPAASLRRELFPGTRRLPWAAAPELGGRSYRIDAELRAALGQSEGVLVATGDRCGGQALHVADGILVHTYHHAGRTVETRSGRLDPATTRLAVILQLRSDGSADIELAADGEVVGTGRLAQPATARQSYAGLDVGVDRGPGVGDYRAPFRFTGSLRRVVIVAGPGTTDWARAMLVDLATG